MKNNLTKSLHQAFSLDNETALITGGGSGLGFAMAQCLVSCGARVVLIGRNENRLKQSVKKIGKNAVYRVHDITDFEKSEELVESVKKSHKNISILINNAGIHLKKPTIETEVDDFQKVINTHILASHVLVKLVLPDMLKKTRGSILFTASMASYIGLPKIVAYSAVKSAFVGMVRSLASEVSSNGIRVNAIAPGWIETPMLNEALSGDDDRKKKIIERTPMKKFGEPMDIGWTAAFLCSPAAKFITGAVIPVDGGAHIGF